MSSPETPIRVLLERWHGGDRAALDELLERTLPWLRRHVQRRLGDKLRRKAQTTDFVQDAAVELLDYGPRFLVANEAQFRALVARIVENVLRDRYDWFHARRRAIDREQPLPRSSVIDLQAPQDRVDQPSEALDQRDSEAWLRLGVRLLRPEDQQVVYLRQWDGASFADIGERLGTSEDAARMRFQRALARLGEKVVQLRTGSIAQATDYCLEE